MKEWKNKDVIAGLIVIIVLGLIALFLLVRREMGTLPAKETELLQTVEEEEVSQTALDEVLEETLVEEIPVEESSTQNETEIEENTIVETEEMQVSEGVSVVTNKIPGYATAKGKGQQQLYAALGKETYTPATLTDRKKEDGQLKELYEYWENYKLNAVGDLIRLERLQEISAELSGTNKFYYYGSVDRLGRPSGKGVAVYADNTYYYGDWKDGLRHGNGMWLEVAIYTEDSEKENLGVVEHSYNGQWSKDFPNGEGQEHFTYDYEILDEDFSNENKVIANVIGNFKNGYYHGEMYIMTTDAKGDTLDWTGNCQNGVWDVIMEGKTTDAVWENYDDTKEERYHYLFPSENKNWGIIGLKK